MSEPSWKDVKEKLAGVDQAGLLSLLHDLYKASKDNRTFIHTRFGLGDDLLKPYKEALERWLWPDMFGNQPASVSKAKQAITDYKRAIGDVAGLAELMVFYCECAAGFAADVGLSDASFFSALTGMFRQASKAVKALPADGRKSLWARLDDVRKVSNALGYGVGEEMDTVLSQRGLQ